MAAPGIDDHESAEYPLQVLREYALLADGERGALIGPRGDVVWMCAPRWDSDALFSALIGGSGSYAVTPADARFVWGGSYEEGSLIWRARWITEGGVIECRDALAFPGDAARAVLLRRIIAVEGDARVRVRLDVRPGFGRHRLCRFAEHGGVWSGRADTLSVRWSGAEAAATARGTDDGDALSMDLTVPQGQYHDLVLEVSDRTLPGRPPDAEQCWRATEAAWRQAVPECSALLAPRDSRHAYAVLRGLTGADGGMVAAATTSLPERAGQGRNYDYRYVWIRDQCFTGQAIAADGPHPLLDDAVRFVSGRLLDDGPALSPAYTSVGGRVPDQRSLHLPGYPGGHDIVGNHVNSQFQLDAFGEALLLFAAAIRHDHLEAEGWRAVEIAADVIAARWGEPEAGIWELDDQQWTQSRLTCVAGLLAVSRAPGAPRPRRREWEALADAILTETAATCTHPSGRWQRAPDDERVDAALLLPGIRGALPSADPRTAATLSAVRQELDEEGYVYRFRQRAGALGDAEGAFVLCGFLTALAVHQQGDPVAAMHYFERNRAACGPPALYAEEYDVTEHQLRGNLPQAFVHALLFEASVRLTRPWEQDR